MKKKTKRTSVVLAVRVPRDLAEEIAEAVGERADFSEWARTLFAEAVRGQSNTPEMQRSEGWRAGWTHANQTFREALRRALVELEKSH